MARRKRGAKRWQCLRVRFFSRKVLVHQTDDMEAIGNNPGVGKVLTNDGSIGRGKIHTHDPYQMLAFEAIEIRLQGKLASPECDVVNRVILQVAEGRGISMFPGKEMLINAKHLGTGSAGPLRRHASEKVFGVAFDGGAADRFPLGHTAAADAIPIVFEDFEAKGLGGMLARQNAANR